MARLIVKFMNNVIQEFELPEGVSHIGRDGKCDVVIDNKAVSSYHSKIYRQGGNFIIEDANSSNGTFLNGKRIFKSDLADGDTIVIGKHSLIFETGWDEGLSFESEFGSGNDETTIILDRSQQEKYVAMMSGLPRSEKECRAIGGIRVMEGKADSRYYLMRSRLVTIGKEKDSDIRIRGFFAPKVAAHIYRRRDGYYLIPPTTGKEPLVNGEKVKKEKALRNGDIIEAGGLKMAFFQKLLG